MSSPTTNRFNPDTFHIHWSDIADGTTTLLKHAGTGIVSAYLFWVNPGLSWAAAHISLPMAHLMRESADKVMNIWHEHKGITCALIYACSFLSLPSVILAGSFMLGTYVGSNLQIASEARKAIGIYEKCMKKELSDGTKQAFFEFLYADRNLQTYNSLFEHLQKIKVQKDEANDPVLRALRNERTKKMSIERSAVLNDLIDLKGKIREFAYPRVITATINALALPILQP